MKVIRSQNGQSYTGQITEHKFWEAEYIWDKRTDLSVIFRLNSKDDHAGLRLGFHVGKFYFGFTVYDHRHWDYDNDTWKDPDEEA